MCLCHVPGEEVISGPHLSPVESVLNFIWILRSTRFGHFPPPNIDKPVYPSCSCYNLHSSLCRYRYLRCAKLMPVSSRSCVFFLLSDTTRAKPRCDSYSPTNLVCILVQILGLFSPILGTCARSLFFLRVRIQNINSQYSSLSFSGSKALRLQAGDFLSYFSSPCRE